MSRITHVQGDLGAWSLGPSVLAVNVPTNISQQGVSFFINLDLVSGISIWRSF